MSDHPLVAAKETKTPAKASERAPHRPPSGESILPPSFLTEKAFRGKSNLCLYREPVSDSALVQPTSIKPSVFELGTGHSLMGKPLTCLARQNCNLPLDHAGPHEHKPSNLAPPEERARIAEENKKLEAKRAAEAAEHAAKEAAEKAAKEAAVKAVKEASEKAAAAAAKEVAAADLEGAKPMASSRSTSLGGASGLQQVGCLLKLDLRLADIKWGKWAHAVAPL